MPARSCVTSKTAASYVGEDSCSSEVMSTATSSTRFPLPAGYFSTVHVSLLQREEFKDLVGLRVNAMLAEEYRYAERLAQQHPVVQPAEWKFVRSMKDLDVYQRRVRGRSRQEVAAQEEFPEAAIAVERGNPSMLVNGIMNGTMEDMLYGASATTQEEMMTGFSITSPPLDAALLRVLEHSSLEDPLHSAELLWVLTKLPLLCPRDVCFLKATGIGRDVKGVPYGYMVLHSVDISECPPFDYRNTKVLRAKMYFSFLFRELTPNTLHVSGRGIFDLAGGEMLKLVLPHATAAVIGGLLRAASCGETKKLTLLASRYHNERHHVQASSKRHVCSMCIRGKQRLLPGARRRSCAVCNVLICKNCKIKDRKMFVGTKQPWREVTCCATCLQQARSITNVRLGEPEFMVMAEFYDKNRLIATSSSASCLAIAAAYSMAPSEASARQAPVRSTHNNGPDRLNEVRKLTTASSLPFDAGKTSSSVAVTNSTIGDSCAGFDCDVSLSFSGPLSDLNSGDYRFNSSVLHLNRDIELDEESEVAAELLQEYAELDTDVVSTSRAFHVATPAYQPRPPNNMFEWMMELHLSAEEAYVTAKANEALMKKSMR
uniref:FYVE-type domain-containing protein n=1 Tax=Hyaloperonospora arabidopsidis (strain Emoy2) TaxID=559515 RepID=M4C056_HYAAE